MRGEDEMTPEVIKRQMTDAEWQKVYDMSRDKNLYHNLCSSLFPAIYGELVTIENEQERTVLRKIVLKQLLLLGLKR